MQGQSSRHSISVTPLSVQDGSEVLASIPSASPDPKNPGSQTGRTRISNSCNPKTQIPEIRLLHSQHALTIGAHAEHGG
jgi:hypothetical protein